MYLPPEIIHTILIILPLKSIVRFSCVSKSWQSQVSLVLSARSRKLFAISTHGQKMSRFVQKPLQMLALSSRDVYHPVDIVGSCNGLVCVIVVDTATPFRSRPLKTILWNPATKKFKELPSSFTTSENIMFLKTANFIEVEHGFGYDETNDDYKVVESIHLATPFVTKRWLKIYSLKSDSWRFVSRKAYETYGMVFTKGVFVNGSIHWLLEPPNPTICTSVLGVNMTTENCREMAAPSGHDSYGCQMLGRGSEDRLSLLYSNNEFVDCWMMMEYDDVRTWTKVLRFQLGQISRGLVKSISLEVPEYDEGSRMSLNERWVQRVVQFDELSSTIDYVTFQCPTYRESLVSVSPQAPRKETNQIRRLVLAIVLVPSAYCVLLLLNYLNLFFKR